MGTIMKLAQATIDLEDAFVAEDVYKHNDILNPEEAVTRCKVYGEFIAMLVIAAMLTVAK